MTYARVHAGTSGYSYKEWKGTFYPEKLPQAQFLEFYSGKFSTVEINNTFYRFPAAKLLEDWRDTTPDGFTFAVKSNMRITHKSRLKDAAEVTHDFIDRCRVLEAKLGPILFQLPPNMKRDDQRLEAFLETLLPGTRYTIEFRHSTWFDDAVFAMLSGAGVALCLSEGEKLDTPRRATADFCYLRLRKDEYTEDELADWSRWITEQAAGGREVFVYLKHDGKGSSPEQALRLLEGA